MQYVLSLFLSIFLYLYYVLSAIVFNMRQSKCIMKASSFKTLSTGILAFSNFVKRFASQSNSIYIEQWLLFQLLATIEQWMYSDALDFLFASQVAIIQCDIRFNITANWLDLCVMHPIFANCLNPLLVFAFPLSRQNIARYMNNLHTHIYFSKFPKIIRFSTTFIEEKSSSFANTHLKLRCYIYLCVFWWRKPILFI